jgi:hypothetical protein
MTDAYIMSNRHSTRLRACVLASKEWLTNYHRIQALIVVGTPVLYGVTAVLVL